MKKNPSKVTILRAKSSARKFGGEMGDYLPLHQWFDETETWLPDDRHMAFRHHAQGIFEAEKRFGYVIKNSAGKDIPTRVICEAHITEDLGFIPTAEHWLKQIGMNKWMGFRDKNLILKLREENETTKETIKDLVTKKNKVV